MSAFNKSVNSLSDNLCALNNSSTYKGDFAEIQDPDTNSNGGFTESSIIRPSSVKQAINNTPSNQDLQSEMSTAASQDESSASSSNIIINQKDGSVKGEAGNGAIYEKWRMRKHQKLTKEEQRIEYDAEKRSKDMWDSYLEKSGATPEVLRMASSSLMEFMRNTSPAEPRAVHLPSRNQRSYEKRLDGIRNTAITSSSSLSPKYILDSNIQNTPFNQDLSNEISTATSKDESLTSSPNTIINQKDGSVNSKTATLQGENQSTIQKTIDKSAVFVTPTSADAPPRKNPPIPTESDTPAAVMEYVPKVTDADAPPQHTMQAKKAENVVLRNKADKILNAKIKIAKKQILDIFSDTNMNKDKVGDFVDNAVQSILLDRLSKKEYND
ncbi:MAG: hypothetical protein RR716_07965, partial [Christensenellaceae bacterium]